MIVEKNKMASIQSYKRPSGFTLIEMLVVLAILGILTALSLENFWFGRDRARYQDDFQNMVSAIQMARNNSVSMKDLAQLPTGPTPTFNHTFLGYGMRFLVNQRDFSFYEVWANDMATPASFGQTKEFRTKNFSFNHSQVSSIIVDGKSVSALTLYFEKLTGRVFTSLDFNDQVDRVEIKLQSQQLRGGTLDAKSVFITRGGVITTENESFVRKVTSVPTRTPVQAKLATHVPTFDVMFTRIPTKTPTDTPTITPTFTPNFTHTAAVEQTIDARKTATTVVRHTQTAIAATTATQSAQMTSTQVSVEATATEIARWVSPWKFREKITVVGSKVRGTHTDFPLYIDLSTLSSHFWNRVRSDGKDILVTSGDAKTILSRELVFFNKTSQQGELWFKAPLLSSSVTEFFIYYGDELPSTYWQSNSTNTWNNGFKMVHHMGGGASQSGQNIYDSTVNANNGTWQQDTWVSGSRSTYDRTAGNLTFDQARAVCQSRGGDIVSITDASEREDAAAACGPRECWIGLQRNTFSMTNRGAHVNDFSWLDGTLAYTYASYSWAWSPGEPNNFDSVFPEGCVHFYGTGLWNDLRCSPGGRDIAGICEYKQNILTTNNALVTSPGKIGRGIFFDGDRDYITVPHSTSLYDVTHHTFQIWARPQEGVSVWKGIAGKVGAQGRNYTFFFHPRHPGEDVFFHGSFTTTTTSNVATVSRKTAFDRWQHVVFTNNGSVSRLYVDGELRWSTSFTGTNVRDAVTFYIGTVAGFPSFLGDLDEIQLSDSDRGEDWIITSYNNQSTPSTFYTVAPHESR